MIDEMLDDPRFKPTRRIGSGGQGIVYLAEDTLFKTQVAIKVLKSDITEHMTQLRKLLHEEARVQAELSPVKDPHPNIVYIIHVGNFGDNFGIVMEYVDGGSIFDKMTGKNRQKTALPFDEALQYTIDMCTGLKTAHQKRIIHRDIKPRNALIRKADGVVKLTDWGVAKNIEIAGIGSSFVGTYDYMSPEVIECQLPHLDKDRPKVDHRTDIYSLGVTMYEMFTGRVPFSNPMIHGVEQILRGLTEQHEELLISRGLNSSLVAIISKAMARDPDARYHTAEEMLDALNRCGKDPGSKPVGSTDANQAPPKPVGGAENARPAADRWIDLNQAPAKPVSGAENARPAADRWIDLNQAPPVDPAGPVDAEDAGSTAVEMALEAVWNAYKNGSDGENDEERKNNAERKYQDILSHNPRSPLVYLKIARFYIHLQALEKAMEMLKKGIDVAPRYAPLLHARAGLFQREGNVTAAIDDLKMALRLGGLPSQDASRARSTLGRLTKKN